MSGIKIQTRRRGTLNLGAGTRVHEVRAGPPPRDSPRAPQRPLHLLGHNRPGPWNEPADRARHRRA
jgi:hypothetical protein